MQGAGSAASCHDNIISAVGLSCTTKQSLQSALGRPGLVGHADSVTTAAEAAVSDSDVRI